MEKTRRITVDEIIKVRRVLRDNYIYTSDCKVNTIIINALEEVGVITSVVLPKGV